MGEEEESLGIDAVEEAACHVGEGDEGDAGTPSRALEKRRYACRYSLGQARPQVKREAYETLNL